MVIQFCGAQVLCFFFSLTMVGLLQKAGFAAFQPPDGSGAVLVATLGFQGVTWVLIPLFLRRHQMGWRDAFGIRDPRLLWVLGLTVILIPFVLLAAWGLEFLSGSVLAHFGRPPETQLTVSLLANARAGWMQVYLGVFAVVLAPVAEEFIFRGVLYPFIKQQGYPRLAWFGVSFAFALVHNDVATLLPLFVLALVLTWLYEMTDNLLAPIAAHASFNAVNLAVIFFQK